MVDQIVKSQGTRNAMKYVMDQSTTEQLYDPSSFSFIGEGLKNLCDKLLPPARKIKFIKALLSTSEFQFVSLETLLEIGIIGNETDAKEIAEFCFTHPKFPIEQAANMPQTTRLSSSIFPLLFEHININSIFDGLPNEPSQVQIEFLLSGLRAANTEDKFISMLPNIFNRRRSSKFKEYISNYIFGNFTTPVQLTAISKALDPSIVPEKYQLLIFKHKVKNIKLSKFNQLLENVAPPGIRNALIEGVITHDRYDLIKKDNINKLYYSANAEQRKKILAKKGDELFESLHKPTQESVLERYSVIKALQSAAKGTIQFQKFDNKPKSNSEWKMALCAEGLDTLLDSIKDKPGHEQLAKAVKSMFEVPTRMVDDKDKNTVLEAMDAAIVACGKSGNFKDDKKVHLQILRAAYNQNPLPETLTSFLKFASESRKTSALHISLSKTASINAFYSALDSNGMKVVMTQLETIPNKQKSNLKVLQEKVKELKESPGPRLYK